ncbi:MAG: ABC transporter permease, partial [Candidatus Atribacteria bacterium]|nr:ABC transporter permease [Candidatus Atribacteria bacterium]
MLSFASPYFLKVQNLLNILRQISYTGIIALGMTFIIISGGIDLSVGSMTAFVGGMIILTSNHFAGTISGIFIAILVGLLLGTAGGMLNGIIVTKGKISPFIATLGTMSIFRSLTLYISNAGEFRVVGDYYGKVGSAYFASIPIPVWLFIILTVFFQILLNNTRFGRYVCAVGSNEQVANYSAIKVNTVKFIAYAITGFTIGVTSIMLSSRLNSISS